MGFEPTTLRVLDALTSELLKTRWRARVIFVGWTCEPHLAVTQSITSNTSQIFFCVLSWLILYISLYFLYNINISGIKSK